MVGGRYNVFLFQDILTETAREQLSMGLSKRVKLLAKVIEDALAWETPLVAKLAVFKELEKQLRYLGQFLRIEAGDDKPAEEILTGLRFLHFVLTQEDPDYKLFQKH